MTSTPGWENKWNNGELEHFHLAQGHRSQFRLQEAVLFLASKKTRHRNADSWDEKRMKLDHQIIVGGWTTHLKNILVKLDHSPIYIQIFSCLLGSGNSWLQRIIDYKRRRDPAVLGTHRIMEFPCGKFDKQLSTVKQISFHPYWIEEVWSCGVENHIPGLWVQELPDSSKSQTLGSSLTLNSARQ